MAGENQTKTTIAVPPKSAPKDPKSDPTFFPKWIWAAASISAVLLVAAVAIALLKRWQKRQASQADEPVDQLASFRALYERGELSQEEYNRIRGRIAKRIKEEGSPPSKPGSPPAPPPAAPTPPGDAPPADTRFTDQPPA